MTGEAELTSAVDRLIGQVSHWTPPRWRAASGVCGLSRADVFHALVQRIADLSADAEGQPRRSVPRLENDLALPDQLVVVTRDLLRATSDPALLAAAREVVAETRSLINYG
jgi:hypothetical protein